jgi:hypothetical protein
MEDSVPHEQESRAAMGLPGISYSAGEQALGLEIMAAWTESGVEMP